MLVSYLKVLVLWPKYTNKKPGSPRTPSNEGEHKAYPWNSYVVDVTAAPDEGAEFMRQRLRKILTAFRSHSKGALVRLAAKINHSRMTKDAHGVVLLDRLIEDKILIPFDAEKFYQLDPDVMGQKLGVGYHDLAQSRFTPETNSYFLDVLGKVKD